MIEASVRPLSTPPRAELARRMSAVDPEPRAPRELNALGRAELLCDPGSFVAVGRLRHTSARDSSRQYDGDGVVTGFGTVDGRVVAVASHEFSHGGGAIGAGFAEKVATLQ